MPFAAAPGQFDLLLPIGEALLLLVGGSIMAPRTTHAFGVQGRLLVIGTQREPAGPAEFMGTGGKAMPDGHAFIEDEALAFPETFGLGDVLEVFQSATVEVVDLVDAGPLAPTVALAVRAAGAAGAAGVASAKPNIIKI